MADLGAVLLGAALTALVTSAAAGVADTIARALVPVVAGGPRAVTSRALTGATAASRVALWTALALLAVALAVRAVETGRAPWATLHEVSQAFALAVLLAYVVLGRLHQLDALRPAVAAAAAVLVAHALTLPGEPEPLVPALQQPVLLTVHVAAAVAAYGVYALALVLAVAELVQRGRHPVGWLPGSDTLRAAAHRAVIFGYPLLTAAIVLGAVWANLAWRSYWSNDPKELTAAATWLIYGAYLHVAGRRDRWGRLAPWLIVAGFGGIVLTYIGANLVFPGQHSYTGV